MREIWKFPLEITDRQIVSMPRMHDFLTVQLQNGKPVLWAIVQPKSDREEVRIYCVGTGNGESVLYDCPRYLGTVQITPFVWHYFTHGSSK